MSERRRSIFREKGRRRGSLILIAVLLVAAASLFVWLRSSDVFAVKRITATATEWVTQEQIAKATSNALGVSLLSLSTKSIKDELTALPYVRSVDVYRDFPNTLEVHLVEYRPTARLRAGDGETWLVSENGRVLEKAGSSSGSSLPLVVPADPVSPVAGEQLPVAVAKALPVVTLLQKTVGGSGDLEELPDAKEVGVSAAGEITLKLSGGLEVRLGAPTELEYKLTVAAKIIQQCLRNQIQVEYVDVSVPDRAAVKPK